MTAPQPPDPVTYNLRVNIADDPSFRALRDGEYDLYAGLNHPQDPGYHDNHKHLGTPVRVTSDSVLLSFQADPPKQSDYWIATGISNISGEPPDPTTFQLVQEGQVYTYLSGVVKVENSATWVAATGQIGIQNDVKVKLYVWKKDAVNPGETQTPPDPKIDAPWKSNLPAFVPGSGKLRLPNAVNRIYIWFQNGVPGDPDNEDDLGYGDQTKEYLVLKWTKITPPPTLTYEYTVKYDMVGGFLP